MNETRREETDPARNDNRVLMGFVGIFASPFLIIPLTRSPFGIVGIPLAFVYMGGVAIARRRLASRSGILTGRSAIAGGIVSILFGLVGGIGVLTAIIRDLSTR